MSGLLFDTSVLLDIATADPLWLPWSEKQFRMAATQGRILINPGTQRDRQFADGVPLLSSRPSKRMFLPMPMTLDQIVEETRHWPPEVVAELIDRILLARHGGIEPEVEAAWKTEIDRRIAEIQEGKVQGIPVEASLARIGKIVSPGKGWFGKERWCALQGLNLRPPVCD